jgi:hypothetical protein
MASDRFWPKLLLSAVLVLCLSGPAGAAVLSAESPTQVAPLEIPETLTPQQVDQILAGLTDAQVRQLLAGELRAKAEDAAARQQGGGGGLGVRLVQLRLGLERLADTLLQRAGQVSRGMALLPDELMTSIDKVSGGRGLGGFLGQIVMFLGLMLLGVAAHWGLRRVMAPARERIEAPAEVGLFDRFCGVAFRAIFDLLAVGGFAAVTLGLAVLIFAETRVR